ncbi:hypothetical protein EDD29_0026 [Actinocorallia herbida]|uniref:Uncharacterized protein n=1 Tax=Actinocorallia herbida TaxID=58109 RepID=A0A3N1CMK4_9ACTN|nr:hypothetical protein [Actinocorallia herbida]ROO82546.1 hypothetical protein EDD29_0026 [Actinocorallia herbida]
MVYASKELPWDEADWPDWILGRTSPDGTGLYKATRRRTLTDVEISIGLAMTLIEDTADSLVNSLNEQSGFECVAQARLLQTLAQYLLTEHAVQSDLEQGRALRVGVTLVVTVRTDPDGTHRLLVNDDHAVATSDATDPEWLAVVAENILQLRRRVPATTAAAS